MLAPVNSSSPLLTDAYKFSMAQAGFPLRRETYYFSFRRGGFQHIAIDLEQAVRRLLTGLRASEQDAAFARAHGYGLTDAMDRALGDVDAVEIEAIPRGTWVYEREPILTITGPSFLVSWLEPMLLWLNHPIQLATELRRLDGESVPAELLTATCAGHAELIAGVLADAGRSGEPIAREDEAYVDRVRTTVRALIQEVGDPDRIFEVGMRSAVCVEHHRIALAACRAEGVTRTSDIALARELDMIPVGTMAHEHVQRWGADLPAFQAMRDMRSAPPSYLLDTFDTMGSGIRAAVEVMRERPHQCAIRYDSGNKFIQYLHACEVLHEQRLEPTHVLEDGLDLAATGHFERLRQFTGWPAHAQVYGFGGTIVAAPMSNPLTRDRVSAVFKLSSTGQQPRMKFGNESGVGKQSVPGRPVVWRRIRGDGPIGIIGQAGETVPEDYVLLSGNPEALEQLRLCNVLDWRRVEGIAAAQRTAALSTGTQALITRVRASMPRGPGNPGE
jgi:nicotinic acid phosphoribosyltransferase